MNGICRTECCSIMSIIPRLVTPWLLASAILAFHQAELVEQTPMVQEVAMQHHSSEPSQFRAAEQAARAGQREAAYRLMCQALIENPCFVPAWLAMSKLVDDPARQRECLERALALDPHNQAARDDIE